MYLLFPGIHTAYSKHCTKGNLLFFLTTHIKTETNIETWLRCIQRPFSKAKNLIK